MYGRDDLSNDEMRLGVVDEAVYAAAPCPARSGPASSQHRLRDAPQRQGEGVICVVSQPDNDMEPHPATTVEEIS